jgi:nitrogen fixation NifU-like protein
VNRQEQLELLLEHYNQPCCRERLEGADASVPGGNPGCGDIVTVYLEVSKEDGSAERIDRATFLGSGCTISQAAASMLMEEVNDAHPTLDEVLQMDYEDAVEVLGREVVESRPRCATLALGTLKAAVRRYQREKLRRESGLPVEDPKGEPEFLLE